MSHEAITIVADFAADQEYGINAILPRLPHDPWNELAPEIVVADECRSPYVARRIIPAGVDHAVMVFMATDMTFDGTPERPDNTSAYIKGSIDVLLLYAVRKSAAQKGVLFTKDILRAIRNCVLLLDEPANSAHRTRNGVALAPMTAIRQVTLEKQEGDALWTSGVVATYATRESVARATP